VRSFAAHPTGDRSIVVALERLAGLPAQRRHARRPAWRIRVRRASGLSGYKTSGGGARPGHRVLSPRRGNRWLAGLLRARGAPAPADGCCSAAWRVGRSCPSRA